MFYLAQGAYCRDRIFMFAVGAFRSIKIPLVGCQINKTCIMQQIMVWININIHDMAILLFYPASFQNIRHYHMQVISFLFFQAFLILKHSFFCFFTTWLQITSLLTCLYLSQTSRSMRHQRTSKSHRWLFLSFGVWDTQEKVHDL